MAALFAELIVDLIRSIAGAWLKQAAIAVCAWLDTRIHGRAARLIVGGLLGLAAFFLIPVLEGLLGL